MSIQVYPKINFAPPGGAYLIYSSESHENTQASHVTSTADYFGVIAHYFFFRYWTKMIKFKYTTKVLSN